MRQCQRENTMIHEHHNHEGHEAAKAETREDAIKRLSYIEGHLAGVKKADIRCAASTSETRKSVNWRAPPHLRR
jgi:DNA-binding FrmR family transcriptional regulator